MQEICKLLSVDGQKYPGPALKWDSVAIWMTSSTRTFIASWMQSIVFQIGPPIPFCFAFIGLIVLSSWRNEKLTAKLYSSSLSYLFGACTHRCRNILGSYLVGDSCWNPMWWLTNRVPFCIELCQSVTQDIRNLSLEPAPNFWSSQVSQISNNV